MNFHLIPIVEYTNRITDFENANNQLSPVIVIVQEEEYLSGFGVENSSYGSYGESYGARSRTAEPHPTSLTSELEGDKMVLKIAKPPRDKDSIVSLSWQCCSWMVSVIFTSF